METPASDNSRFVQFLIPDSTFHSRPRLFGEWDRVAPTPQERHVVLEALARMRNNRSPFFLREINFYENYYTGIARGRCFGCNQQKAIWANFPCQHLLWCGKCKFQVTLAARNCKHRCVVCDMKVVNMRDESQLLYSQRFNPNCVQP